MAPEGSERVRTFPSFPSPTSILAILTTSLFFPKEINQCNCLKKVIIRRISIGQNSIYVNKRPVVTIYGVLCRNLSASEGCPSDPEFSCNRSRVQRLPGEAGFRIVYHILLSLSEDQYTISQNLSLASSNGIVPRMDAHCQTYPASGSNQVPIVASALNPEASTRNL